MEKRSQFRNGQLLWTDPVACMPENRLPKRVMLSWVHEPRIEGGQQLTFGRSLERHLNYFGLVDDSGKAVTISEWATLAQDSAGWLKLVTKMPFDTGKPQLRPPSATTGHAIGEAELFGLARYRDGTAACSLVQCRNRRRRDLSLIPKYIS